MNLSKLNPKVKELLPNPATLLKPTLNDNKTINLNNAKKLDLFLESNTIKNTNSLNISELIDFSKFVITETKRLLSNELNQKNTLDELKKIIFERLFWNKKGKFEAKLNQVSEPGSISRLQTFNFSLNLSIKYQDIKIMEGKINYSELYIEINLEFTSELKEGWLDVEGSELKLIDNSTLDTGRYYLKFLNKTDFMIYDKITALYTRIWGDPHVDLSDVEGDFNGEFSDLRESFFRTKFVLLDGTNIIFNAPDTGVIESVFVTKGNSKAFGLGTYQNLNGQMKWSPLEKDKIDVVYAGGDGNDWYDKDGRLVWGG